MSVILKQSAGALVKPVDDARLYNLLLSGQTGIAEGCNITHLGANQLQIAAGWGVCQGRMFTIEQETITASVSASGEVNGRLLLHIDVSAETPAVFRTQAVATLPALTQEDINGSGTVYEMELATYKVDELTISNFEQKFSYITGMATKEMVETAQETAASAAEAVENLTPSSIGAATADQGTKADNAMPKSAFSLSGTTLTITW